MGQRRLVIKVRRSVQLLGKGEAMVPANDPNRSCGPDSSNSSPPEPASTQVPSNLLELTEECKRLRSELAKVQEERNRYRDYLSALTYQGFDMTKEEVLALVNNQKPFEEFLAELEKSVGS
jgi:hypothetical protein